MAQTDFRSLSRIDQIFIGLGVLVLIAASFLPWYGVSFSIGIPGHTVSSNSTTHAWHGWAALGIILMLVATALVVEQLLPDTKLPELKVSWNVIVLALDALGALLIVIKSFNLPSASVPGFSVGLRWGGWILIIAAIAQVVVAVMRFRASGESMPWAAEPPDASAV
jgi:hypothetical protein